MSGSSAALAHPARPSAPRPVSDPHAEPDPRPRLRLVRPPQASRSRVPFILGCMGLLVAALLCALVLNTSMARGAYEKADMDRQLARLAQDERDLTSQIDQESSPARLADSARALGMVPSGTTAWLRLSDGTVHGLPTPAGAQR